MAKGKQKATKSPAELYAKYIREVEESITVTYTTTDGRIFIGDHIAALNHQKEIRKND